MRPRQHQKTCHSSCNEILEAFCDRADEIEDSLGKIWKYEAQKCEARETGNLPFHAVLDLLCDILQDYVPIDVLRIVPTFHESQMPCTRKRTMYSVLGEMDGT